MCQHVDVLCYMVMILLCQNIRKKIIININGPRSDILCAEFDYPG